MSRIVVCLVCLSVLCTLSGPYAIAVTPEPTSTVEYPLGGSLSNADPTGALTFSGSLNVQLGDDTGAFYGLNSMTFDSGIFSAIYAPIFVLSAGSSTQPAPVELDLVSPFIMTTTGSPGFDILSLSATFSNSPPGLALPGVSGLSAAELITLVFEVNSPLDGSITIGVDSADFEDGFIGFNAVPEPSTFVLGILGLLSLGMIGRRRKRR